jgi:Leucine-rich repeat (LRR) protein
MSNNNNPDVSSEEGGSCDDRVQLREVTVRIGYCSSIRVAASISEIEHQAITQATTELNGNFDGDLDDDHNDDHNDALRFVASSIPNIRHVWLSFTGEYTCNGWGDELIPDGNVIRNILGTEGLESVTIVFDSSTQNRTAPLVVCEHGLSALPQSLKNLTIRNPYFSSVRALSEVIRPLANLEQLHLDFVNVLEVPNSEYIDGNWKKAWKDPSEFMHALGSLSNLRALSMLSHRITDDDLLPLSSLSELVELNLVLESDYGTSLTDAAMEFIASSFPKLELLDVSGNYKITEKGNQEVLSSCPSLVCREVVWQRWYRGINLLP